MSESIVCPDPANCPREHVGGMGGTPVHLPPDGVVVPGHFDHGVPSDYEPKVTPGGNPICERCGQWYGIGVKHTCPPDLPTYGSIRHLRECDQPHGGSGNPARVYGHHGSVRTCIRLYNSDVWVYDPRWEGKR